MAQAKEEVVKPKVKGETVREEGTKPLTAPQAVKEAKQKITLPNGTVIEHY